MSEQLNATHTQHEGQPKSINLMPIFSQATACSPKGLLRIILYGALGGEKNSTTDVLRESFQSALLQRQNSWPISQLFALKRTANRYPIHYTSVIAHQLAAFSSYSAPEIAELLTAQALSQPSYLTGTLAHSPLPVEVLAELGFRSNDAGYLEFGFSDRAIADYLKRLLDTWPQFLPALIQGPHELTAIAHLNQRIFALQHSHARCCSLLRLVERNHGLQLDVEKQQDSICNGQMQNARAVSWLTPIQQFQTSHPTELQLISQIVQVLDAVEDSYLNSLSPPLPSEIGQKTTLMLFSVAEGLSQAFQIMHQHWPLIGSLQTQPPDHMNCHLRLILITQRLLNHLLQQLGIEAPIEL